MLISRSDSFDFAFFRAAKWFLWFLGLWPLNPVKPLTVVATFLNILILFTDLVGEYHLTWFRRSHPFEVLAIICPILTKTVTWMKVVLMVFHRKKVARLMEALFNHLIGDSKDPEKNAMISRVAFFAGVSTVVLFVLSFSTNVSYTAKPLIVWTYHRLTGGTNGSWVSLPFQVALPYEDMTQVGSKTLYTIIFWALFQAGNVTVAGNISVDGVYMYCCMYISISYQCLQKDFRRVFHKYASDGGIILAPRSNGSNDKALYRELSLLIEREQNISAMFLMLNDIYESIIFLDIIFAGVTIAVVLFEFLLVPGMTKLIFIPFATGIMVQMYLYCYGAEHINENRMQVAETLYDCNWYVCSVRVRKLLLFVLKNTQKGNLLKLPFFTPSLPLFTSIIRNSGSYIALMKSVI